MARINLKAIMAIFAVMMAGVLSGCAGGGGDSTPVTAPVVIFASPANQATGVLLTEPISVAFSKPMQSGAFTSTNFTATTLNGDAVSGNIIYANGYATLTPAAPMLPSTLYTATIAAGAQAADGSTLAASYSWSFTTGPLNAVFGNGGVVTTPVSATLGDGARAVAVQADGKVVAVGYVDSGSGNYDFAVIRYNPDGSLDTGFGGGDGIVVTAVSASADKDEARAVVIQPDGKIVVAGVAYNGANTDFAVVRYDANGSLDTAFGGGGIVITDFGASDEAFAVAVYPVTGEIVVVGQTASRAVPDFALARYTSGGTLDAAFDTDGMQTTSFGDGVDAAYSVAIQGDGKIVVAGITDSVSGDGVNNDFALARYDANGVLDATFGVAGKVITAVGVAEEGAFAVGIQSDGKIVAAGVVFNGANNDFGLARYDIDGTLDATFGAASTLPGTVVTDMAGGNDAALALMIQTDNKIVVAGAAFVTNQANDFATARYTADGVLDTTFDTDGKVITNISAAHDTAYGVAQSGGNIVLAGSSGTGASTNFVLVGFAP